MRDVLVVVPKRILPSTLGDAVPGLHPAEGGAVQDRLRGILEGESRPLALLYRLVYYPDHTYIGNPRIRRFTTRLSNEQDVRQNLPKYPPPNSAADFNPPVFCVHQGCADRRNGARSSKRGDARPQKPVHLQELSSMILFNEGSLTGTASDKGTAACGPMSGPPEPTPGRGRVEPPAKSPVVASPSPAPGEGLQVPTDDEKSIEKPVRASPKVPTTANEPQKADDCISDKCGGKKRGSNPHAGGAGNEGKDGKRGNDRMPTKRASSSKGVVAVEADGGDAAGGAGSETGLAEHPQEKPIRVSAQVRIPGVCAGGLWVSFLRSLTRYDTSVKGTRSHDERVV